MDEKGTDAGNYRGQQIQKLRSNALSARANFHQVIHIAKHSAQKECNEIKVQWLQGILHSQHVKLSERFSRNPEWQKASTSPLLRAQSTNSCQSYEMETWNTTHAAPLLQYDSCRVF